MMSDFHPAPNDWVVISTERWVSDPFKVGFNLYLKWSEWMSL